MRYYPNTYFPSSIDPLLYYSDASLKSEETLNRYKECIQSGNMDQALTIVQADTNLHYASASLINKFEVQIKKIQEYLLTKEYVNPMVHDESEPQDPETHFIWIEEN